MKKDNTYPNHWECPKCKADCNDSWLSIEGDGSLHRVKCKSCGVTFQNIYERKIMAQLYLDDDGKMQGRAVIEKLSVPDEKDNHKKD